MSTNQSISKSLLLISILTGVIWTLYSLQYLNQGFFWDLSIYKKAVSVFNMGGNPYELNGYLSFVYHPLVLRLMALFGNYLGPTLVGAYLASLIFFLSCLGSHRSWWLYSFLAFAYCGIGTISIGSGNVTAFFHLTLLGILLRNIRINYAAEMSSFKLTRLFIVTVLIFSLVKPYMLAYLIIPIVSYWGKQDQKSIYLLILLLGAAFILTVLASSLFFGTEFQSFLSAVQGQTIGKRDLGYGLLMYFYDYYLSAGSLIYRAFVLHFTILAVIFVTILFLAKRSGQLHTSEFALLLYFLLTILNPRLKVYDLFPALVALFLFSSSIPKTMLHSCLFTIAYTLSLSQLVDTPFFIPTGLLSDPLNVYYLTMGLVLLGVLPGLFKKPQQTLKR